MTAICLATVLGSNTCFLFMTCSPEPKPSHEQPPGPASMPMITRPVHDRSRADHILSTRTDPRTFSLNALGYISRHRNRAQHLAIGIVSDDRKAISTYSLRPLLCTARVRVGRLLKLRAALCCGRIEAAPLTGPQVLGNNQIETLARLVQRVGK